MAATTIGQVRAALDAALTGLTGVNVYNVWPDDPKDIVTPAILVKPVGAQLDAFGPRVTYRFELAVVCQARLASGAQGSLDALLSFDGATTVSIFQRLWANGNLSGEVENTEANSFRDYGGLAVGVVEFIGALIDVEVWVSLG